MVGRELQDEGIAGEGLAPKVPQSLPRRTRQPLRLAGRHRRIVESRLGERQEECVGGDLPAVEHPQLAQQDPHRPEVGHDVMDREDERLVAAGQLEQPQAEERALLQIERQEGEGREPPGDLRTGGIHRIDRTEIELRLGVNPLAWTVRALMERGAERRMASDQSPGGTEERVPAEPGVSAGERRPGDHVGGIAGSEAIQEPECPLAIGQRQPRRRSGTGALEPRVVFYG